MPMHLMQLMHFSRMVSVALIQVDIIDLMAEIDLLKFSLQSFNQYICHSSCSSSRAEMNTVMSHILIPVLKQFLMQ